MHYLSDHPPMLYDNDDEEEPATKRSKVSKQSKGSKLK